jgi:hypothetical protein
MSGVASKLPGSILFSSISTPINTTNYGKMAVKIETAADGISNLEFKDNLLLSSSWDSKLILYDTINNQTLSTINQRGAILDCKFLSNSIVSGGLDRNLKMYKYLTGLILKL